MDKDTANSSFGQLVAPLNRSVVQKIINNHGTDRYVKKLTTWSLLVLLLQAQLLEKRGLRSVEQMLVNEHLQAELGFQSISSSQLSRTCKRMNPEVFRDIYCNLVKTVQGNMGNEAQRFTKMGPIKIVDSSTVTLCLQKYGWAKHVRMKAGIKIHLRLVFVNEGHVYPEKAVITPAKPDDRKQMGAMIDEAGAMYVFDRGYADYGKFEHYCETNIGFTTRLRRKAIYEVVEELPVTDGSPILRDTIVILGNPQKRMRNVLRRLETVDSQGNSIVILTNCFYVSAEEIGDLYRNRWKIELFFKYIKQHLKMTQFYGTTEKAVQNQIYIGLISYLLLVLMRLKSNGKRDLLYIHRLLVELLWEPWNRMMETIHRKPLRTSKGRQKRE
jgi:hypothetical protein